MLRVACDLPAGRKVCGFLMQLLDGYCGLQRLLWQPRTEKAHRDAVDDIKECTTKSAQGSKESEMGCRYSVLLELPYFDPIRMLPIDPMHNLFLGTGKHMINHRRMRSEGHSSLSMLCTPLGRF